MNQTAASVPGASLLPDTTDLFTTGAFVVIAILMLLAIAGIIFGMRLSRRRREARVELQEHNQQIEAQAPPLAAVPPPLAPEARTLAPAEPPRPAPVAPSRPVLVTPPPAPRAAEPVAAPPSTPRSAEPLTARATGPSPADGPITQLKGLGPKVATRLADLGVSTVGQMAALTDDEAQALDAQLGVFTGRMNRDRWLEQARFLAAGDVKGFEAVFGRL